MRKFKITKTKKEKTQLHKQINNIFNQNISILLKIILNHEEPTMKKTMGPNRTHFFRILDVKTLIDNKIINGVNKVQQSANK